MDRLRDRPTSDLVVMFLAALVGFILVVATFGVILLELYGDDVDISVLATRLAAITNTLIGAIVGYLAGRGTDPPGKSDDETADGEA